MEYLTELYQLSGFDPDQPREPAGSPGGGEWSGGSGGGNKHSPEQLAKWAQEKKDRERAQAVASEKQRAEQKSINDRSVARVDQSAMSPSFTESERNDIKNYYRSGDRLGAQAEGRNATISAIQRSAKDNGLTIEKVSESQGGKSKSLYIRSGNDLVRVSDHELPTTPERMTNRERGLTGRWDREVVISDWQTTTLQKYINEIKGVGN